MKWILILALSCLPVMAVKHRQIEHHGTKLEMSRTGGLVGIYTMTSRYGVEYLEILSKSKGSSGLFIYNAYNEYGYFAQQQLGLFIGRRIFFTDIEEYTSYLYMFNLVKPRASGVIIYNQITNVGTIFSADPAIARKQ